MFDEVVVGVDFGPGGDAAVRLARRLVRPGGRLTLTHVVGSEPTVLRGQRDADVDRERAQSLNLLDRERSLVRLDAGSEPLPDVGVCAVCAASVRRGLRAVAEHHGADLLVVGASGGGRLQRALLGDDTGGLLCSAPCSVAVAPPAYSGEELRRLTAGDDGDEARRSALAVARALAGSAIAPDDLAAASGEVDLVVVAAQDGGRWRRSRPARLARRIRCPLLVLAPVAGSAISRQHGSAPGSPESAIHPIQEAVGGERAGDDPHIRAARAPGS
jgi:nucleotide-binding universal stress UspA family protein